MMHISNNRVGWFAGILIPISFVVLYWSTIHGLVNQWISAPDYSHGLLIVPIVIYLIWEKRAELKKVDFRTDWRALPVLLFSIAIFIVGELGAELFTTRVSMLILLFGLVWFLCGAEVVKVLRFPLAFLLLMLPLPGFIYRNVTFPLQLFSSATSVNVLLALGISVYREGNIIDIGITQLQVVEACSGLRYILPLLAFGVLYAYLGQKVLWKRIVLVAATIPISIFGNVFRISVTGLIATKWGSKAAESFFHGFSGWLVFMFCTAIFILLNIVLNRLPGSPKKQTDRPEEKGMEPKRVIKWPPVLVALAVILATTPLVGYLGQVPPVPLRESLKAFPLKFEGRTGTSSQMDQKMWEQVGGQEYVIIDYTKPNEYPINFYVAYYEYQKKGGDFIHSPRLCLPGGGWHIDKNRVREISQGLDSSDNNRVLKLNELVISKPGTRQLSYFWYQGRGRNFTNEYAAKFYMVWDGIWRRRTDGALVRLVAPLGPGQSVEDARRTLDAFALKASKKLDEFLP